MTTFNIPKVRARLPRMDVAELKRHLKRAEELNIPGLANEIKIEIARRDVPQVSARDGASAELRHDCATSLAESERIEKTRHNYFRRSLAKNGCKGAIEKAVMSDADKNWRTLENLRSLGILKYSAEHLVLRHTAEFDAEVIARARAKLKRLEQG
jgi:hypothetical protein